MTDVHALLCCDWCGKVITRIPIPEVVQRRKNNEHLFCDRACTLAAGTGAFDGWEGTRTDPHEHQAKAR